VPDPGLLEISAQQVIDALAALDRDTRIDSPAA
jgi:hypothetical protein